MTREVFLEFSKIKELMKFNDTKINDFFSSIKSIFPSKKEFVN